MRPNRFKVLAAQEGKTPKELLKDLYETHEGNQTRVAAAIGITQSRLSQAIREFGLKEKTILVEQEKQCSN